jgi:hypothetical protein
MASETFQNEKYVVLMETNGEECESWLSFIKVKGNEEAINHLQKQLESVNFYIIDDMSTFDLETSKPVSYQTAREMCLLDLNPYMPHRLFHGKLEFIDFDFVKRDDNDDKIEKVHNVLGYGDIDKYIDQEESFDDEFSDHSNVSDSSSYVSDSDDGSESEDDDRKKSTKSPKVSQTVPATPSRSSKSPKVSQTPRVQAVPAPTPSRSSKSPKVSQTPRVQAVPAPTPKVSQTPRVPAPTPSRSSKSPKISQTPR